MGRQDCPNDCYQACWIGHVISHPQAPVNQLAGVFPANLEDIPEYVPMVFLTPATSQEQIVLDGEAESRSQGVWREGKAACGACY